jgi:hypothetical protein
VNICIGEPFKFLQVFKKKMKNILRSFLCVVVFVRYVLGGVTPAMQVIAGDGTSGSSGDFGPGTSAQLADPRGIWADSLGNAYIVSGEDQRVRYVDAVSGSITKILGSGASAYNSVGGDGISFPIYYPESITGDAAGENVYVSDFFHIWKYNIATKQATRYAGGDRFFCGLLGCSSATVTAGDDGPATSAYFGTPAGICYAFDGTLYVADSRVHNVRKISPEAPNIISLVSGNGQGFGGDGSLASSTLVKFNQPMSIYIETTGVIYIADYNFRVRQINSGGIITTVAGGGNEFAYGIPATRFNLANIGGISGDGRGSLYITAFAHKKVFHVNPEGIINVFLGSDSAGTSLGISPLTANLNTPYGIFCSVDSSSSLALYLTELESFLAKKLIYISSPTSQPSSVPSSKPSVPTGERSGQPSAVPSFVPIAEPSGQPSVVPSVVPIAEPTGVPRGSPTSKPAAPTGEPTGVPSSQPAVEPTGTPSTIPSLTPTTEPTGKPSVVPSCVPVSVPTGFPTGYPSAIPAALPTGEPTTIPSASPSSIPSVFPTGLPSSAPSSHPSLPPSAVPSTNPSIRPSNKPSTEPTSEPSSPSFIPTRAPNVNDHVEIVGGVVISKVSDNVFNNQSVTTVTEALKNISGSAQEVVITAAKLLKKKGRTVLDAPVSYSFKIDFVAVYYLSYYSGWNSSFVAEMKLKTIKEAVGDGSFQKIFRSLAAVRNATQLFDGICGTVSLSSTILSPDSSSSFNNHESQVLSDAAIAGIVVGCCMAVVLLFLYLLARYLDEKASAEIPMKGIDIIV